MDVEVLGRVGLINRGVLAASYGLMALSTPMTVADIAGYSKKLEKLGWVPGVDMSPEGSKLADREVERLLSNLSIQSFDTRDEQEVAGYAEVMETVFHAWAEIPLTENHIKQLHRDLLRQIQPRHAWCGACRSKCL